MKDFFISYNSADKAWAEWLAWQVEASGWSVVVQAWDFRPGGNFVLDMNRALTDTRRTIAVLSPSFLAADFTAPEWAATFAADPTGVARRLVPVRVRDCRPGGLLAAIVYIDLVGIRNREEGRLRLLDGLKARVKPEHEPDMPAPDAAATAVVAATDVAEPPWPPALELAGRVAGSLLRRLLRMAGVLAIVALATWLLLDSTLPAYVRDQPLAAGFTSVVWGALVALAVELALHFGGRSGVPQAGEKRP
ncbi:MAG: toll/interleukin-1 receptor domain-containing protein [Caldimonas sp.]